MKARAAHLELEEWPVGWLPEFDLIESIVMSLSGGADVERLIQALDCASDPAAAVHLAAMRRRVVGKTDGFALHSAFLEGEQYRHAAHRLGTWLLGAAVEERIASALLNVEDSRLKEILSKPKMMGKE